ncbi:MAG: hypothetical protein HRT61_15880 [Ekhidna sp.]|nr:hypothetical protein [Ekhidna sp.]
MIEFKALISLLLCLFLLNSFSQKKKISKRLDHINSHTIYVSQMNFEKINKTEKLKSDVPSTYDYKRINQYVRECFAEFWDISDTVIFVTWDELQRIKKKEKKSIFFEFGYSALNNRIQNNSSNYFTSFGISCPGDKKLFPIW